MIVTFYSYKGGVGRSHVLVDVAARLAARGRSVLVWDLDLEAPGLQKIPDLAAVDAKATSGTLDLLAAFLRNDAFDFPAADAWKGAIVDLDLPSHLGRAGGRVSFLLPAKLDESYPKRFTAVDWADLFRANQSAGPAFFHRAARLLADDLGYEFVLIDARTGFTDLGAVCTVQLADAVVAVTNLNAQNLEGLPRVAIAVTGREQGEGRFFVVANMVPDSDSATAPAREQRLDEMAKRLGVAPTAIVPLRPALLLTDRVAAFEDGAATRHPLDALVDVLHGLHEDAVRAREAERSNVRSARARGAPDGDLDELRRRGLLERAKSFEERVAELFEYQGWKATVDYAKAGRQFDVRLERGAGALQDHALVECKDLGRPVPQDAVVDFARAVEEARKEDGVLYRPFLVARSGFANNCHAAAQRNLVQLLTWDQLLRSLVDFRPSLDALVRQYQGTALERLHVENDVVLQAEIDAGRPARTPLGAAVRAWIDTPGANALVLLGDFGVGKTSFCRRLAAELAADHRKAPDATRVPVLVDLREAATATAKLENILVDHFQRHASTTVLPSALLHLNREGHLVLVFDGFDEIIGYVDPARHLDHLRELLRAAEGRAKVIITCRTHYFRDRPDEVRRLVGSSEMLSRPNATRLYEELASRPGAGIGYVLEFTDAQVDAYLQRAFPPPDDWRRFRSRIDATFNLQQLSQTPFLLDLIVKSLPELTAGGRKVDVADLYETYCQRWFDRDTHKVRFTGPSRAQLVEHLARLVWDAPDQQVHYDLLFERATAFFEGKAPTYREKEAIDYEVRTASFLKRNAEGYYSFVHRSFLEFFVARGLRTALKTGDVDALAMRRLTREVAFFLFQWPEAERVPTLAANVLGGPYRARASENALHLLHLHVLASFGPLLGPDRPTAAVDQIRRRFRDVRGEEIHLDGADLGGADLRGADLDGAWLPGADLATADLTGTSLDGAHLMRARMSFARLRDAFCDRADFADAVLDHADASGARFAGARFAGADLAFARFVDADLSMIRSDGAASAVGAACLRARLPEAGGAFAHPSVGAPSPRRLDVILPHCGAAASRTSLAWSTDGRVLAIASDLRGLTLHDPATGAVLSAVTKAGVIAVTFSRDGRVLAAGCEDGTVRLFDAASGKELRAIAAGPAIYSIAFSPDSRLVASGGGDGKVRLFDATSGRELRSLAAGPRTWSVVFSPDGRLLAAGGGDEKVRVFDASLGQELRSLTVGPTTYAVAFSPDGRVLATGGGDGKVRLFEPGSGEQLGALNVDTWIWSVAFSPEGGSLAAGGGDGKVHLHDMTAGKEPRTLAAGPAATAVAFSPNGSFLAVGGGEDRVRLFDVASGKHLRSLPAGCSAYSVAFSPDSRLLATGNRDEVVRLFDAASGRKLRALVAGPWTYSVAFSSDGRLLATGGRDDKVRMFEAASGEEVRVLAAARWTYAIAFSRDGRLFAAAGRDETIHLVDAASGEVLRELAVGHETHSIAFSPDGRLLAAGGRDERIRLFEAESGEEVRALAGGSETHAVAFSPDGRHLAAGGEGSDVRLFDTASGKQLRALAASPGTLSVAFSPGGRRLAAVGRDKRLRIFDPASGKELRVLASGPRTYSVAFSHDGLLAATGRADGVVQVYAAEGLCPLRSLVCLPDGLSAAFHADGRLDATPEALAHIRLGDGWATYSWDEVVADERGRELARDAVRRFVVGEEPESVPPRPTRPRRA